MDTAIWARITRWWEEGEVCKRLKVLEIRSIRLRGKAIIKVLFHSLTTDPYQPLDCTDDEPIPQSTRQSGRRPSRVRALAGRGSRFGRSMAVWMY